MSQAAAAPMSVRLAVRMTSSDSFSCKSTTPSSPHFAKYACVNHGEYPTLMRVKAFFQSAVCEHRNLAVPSGCHSLQASHVRRGAECVRQRLDDFEVIRHTSASMTNCGT